MSDKDSQEALRANPSRADENRKVLARLERFRGRLLGAQRLSREACHERSLQAIQDGLA